MKYLLILFFCFGHFTSYGNNKKVTEDSKATSKLQDNIRYLENVKEIIKEKTGQYTKLQNQIKKTKDEASCKALKVQIGELSKQIKTVGEDHQIIVSLTQLSGSCSKTGYVSHVIEKTYQYMELQNQIRRTKDEASCKALKIQIEKLKKQIKAIALESRMKVGLTQLGSCSKTGYVPPL